MMQRKGAGRGLRPRPAALLCSHRQRPAAPAPALHSTEGEPQRSLRAAGPPPARPPPPCRVSLGSDTKRDILYHSGGGYFHHHNRLFGVFLDHDHNGDADYKDRHRRPEVCCGSHFFFHHAHPFCFYGCVITVLFQRFIIRRSDIIDANDFYFGFQFRRQFFQIIL